MRDVEITYTHIVYAEKELNKKGIREKNMKKKKTKETNSTCQAINHGEKPYELHKVIIAERAIMEQRQQKGGIFPRGVELFGEYGLPAGRYCLFYIASIVEYK